MPCECLKIEVRTGELQMKQMRLFAWLLPNRRRPQILCVLKEVKIIKQFIKVKAYFVSLKIKNLPCHRHLRNKNRVLDWPELP